MIKKRIRAALTGICTAALICASAPGCSTSDGGSGQAKSVDAGAQWSITETTHLSKLSIAKDATITAPEGHGVTLTVDGIETGIASGDYSGEIVLTVTEDIVASATVFGETSTFNLRAAIDVDNGTYMENRSVAAAAVGGSVTDTAATDVSITSVGENFNGIVVTGDSRYTVENSKISLTGNGTNDFVGVGAGILVRDTTNVTVTGADIKTDGVVRVAICANGSSTLTVNDTTIQTGTPALPETTVGMMSVPWVLGLTGTCRSTMATESATVTYNNCHLKAQGWGVLSTDAVKDVKLTVNNSIIETVESGYGAYADGSSVDTFSNCTFNVTDYALIMTQGSGIFTNGTVVNSGRFGVMNHSGKGGEKLLIDNCVFNTDEAVIQVKSSSPGIVVDGATLNSKNGIILQAMMNDDPNTDSGGGMPGGGGGAPGGGTPEGGMQGGDMAQGGMQGGGTENGGMPGGAGGAPGGSMPDMAQGGMPGGEMPEGGMQGGGMSGGGSSDVHAEFKNMTMDGDIITSMTELGELVVSFENTAITGAITTCTWKTRAEIDNVDVSSHGAFSTDGYDMAYIIGDGVKTYCATGDEKGLSVTLDGKSTWTVDETSYLTGLTMADGAAIKAPEGSSVTMLVDGKKTAIKAGTYTGKIELRVTQGA
jgi:hypothetical protein